jgi:hypothetical protein
VARRDGSSPLLAICDATVALYKQAFVAGPRTCTRIMPALTQSSSCSQTLTAAERNLVALGEQDRLRESRLIVQRALEDRLRDTVEGTLGRAIAVMSAIDVDRDVCAEILTLEPRAAASAVSAKRRATGRVRRLTRSVAGLATVVCHSPLSPKTPQ